MIIKPFVEKADINEQRKSGNKSRNTSDFELNVCWGDNYLKYTLIQNDLFRTEQLFPLIKN